MSELKVYPVVFSVLPKSVAKSCRTTDTEVQDFPFRYSKHAVHSRYPFGTIEPLSLEKTSKIMESNC